MRIGCLLGALLLFSLPARADRFFPDTSGSTWEYNRSGAEPGQVIVRIAGRDVIRGKPILKLETLADGKVIKTDLVSATGRGLAIVERRRDSGDVTFDPPAVLFRGRSASGQIGKPTTISGPVRAG